MATAVIKAHSDAANIEAGGPAVPYAFDTVMGQSETVRTLAQVQLSSLEGRYPDIAGDDSCWRPTSRHARYS